MTIESVHASRTTVHAPRRSPWYYTRWLRAPLIAYLLVLLAMMFFEESLIYFPMKYPEGDWQTDGLPIEDAEFTAVDGTRLHGWYVAHERPTAVMLVAHGNAGNITHRKDLLQVLHGRLGVSVLIFDYRGYGRSEGSPDETGVLADARAARQWLAKRAAVAERDIVLLGESLGGGVVVDLAANDGARGLVLENTFSSLPEVAAFHYPWLPAGLMMRNRLDSVSKIANYRGPLLQYHGDKDQTIPMPTARRLFDAANEPKEWIVIPGGDHNDPRRPEFFVNLARFLEALPASGT